MTIFERIVAGEIPCHKVWEDSKHLAFLDIRPIAPGHTLLIPKKAVDPITAMKDSDFKALWAAAHKVAKILETKTKCKRVCMAVVGFEVPHAHIHLVPTRTMLDFPWSPGVEASKDELSKMAASLRAK